VTRRSILGWRRRSSDWGDDRTSQDLAYIAGHLANNPDTLVAWIRHPHRFNQVTAMPEMGVGEQEARDIAAYLYTLQ
jgi:cytochrome c1